MSYKLLYIEDQKADTIKSELINRGFDVEVYEPETFDKYVNHIQKNDYDAYIMDFRLTEGHGLVDAPTYAATQRTFGKNRREKPIILITNENNLAEFENDFTSQDLFDIVLGKANFRNDYDKYSQRIKALIDAYKTIKVNEFDIKTILGINNIEDLDYRFISKLTSFKNKENIYGYSRTILNSLIRAIGPLVGREVLAARLGIESSCADFENLLNKPQIASCQYKGIMSDSYDRWWFDEIKLMWKEISSYSLRRLEAQDRVNILNEKFKLNLQPAKPLKQATSTNFWTICHELKKPLDPIDGYPYNIRHFDEWLEPDYISLDAALEYPELRVYLSPVDQKNVYILGNEQ